MTNKRAPGGGRKPLAPTEPTEKIAVTLLASQVEVAKRLGDGNVSAGIRKAMERVEPVLTKKHKTEIADAIMNDSDFHKDNANLRHLRVQVREMMIEAMDKALKETTVQLDKANRHMAVLEGEPVESEFTGQEE